MHINKPRVLCILNLPPPVHGQGIINQNLVDSQVINERFELDIINLQFTSLNKIGKPTLAKFFKTFEYYYVLKTKLKTSEYQLSYFPISHLGNSRFLRPCFFRDFLYAQTIKRFKIPILFHLHGKGIRYRSKYPLNRFLYKIFFNHSHVIALSNSVADDVCDVYNSSPIIVNNGIVQSISDNDFTNSFQKSSKTFKILFLSNLFVVKGIYDFIDAVEIFSKTTSDFEATIIGAEGNVKYDEITQVLIKKNIINRFRLQGPLFDQEKFKAIMSSDVLVFPSHNECFPLVVLEAMQSGKAIIATSEGALPEIIDDGINGFIIPKQSPQKIAEKLKILADNLVLKTQMGKAGRKKFLQYYTITHFEKRMCQVFSQLAR